MGSGSKAFDANIDDSLPRGLRSIEALHDPFAWYHKNRRASSVQYDDHRGVYDVFSYKQVKEGLQNSEQLIRPPLAGDRTNNALSYFDTAMVWSDGSEHKGVKGELFRYFSPRMLKGIEESIVSITEAQLDTALDDGGEFDFVDEFAVPVPLRVIMSIVGIPQEDHQQLLEWLETFRSVMTSEDSAEGSVKGKHMTAAAEYFETLVDERSSSPQNDLISELAQETDLTDEEIGSNCFDFALAGQGTMSELLGNAIYILDEHDLVGNVDEYDFEILVEEVLRYRSPLQARARKTTEAVTLDGTTIPADETVILWIGAANRDPARFDEPDAFCPHRDPKHLAFGSGAHSCIGAPIARMEAPIILRTFFDTVRDLSLEQDALVPKPKASKLGFDRMPIQAEVSTK